MLASPSTLPPGGAEYDPGDAYDEAFAAPGEPRPLYEDLLEALAGHDLEALREDVAAHLATRGVDFGGSGAWPFVVDPVPRLIDRDEWERTQAGLVQRVRALDAWVADVHGERRAIEAGIVPERVLAQCAFAEPDLHDVPPPPGARIGIAGLDMVRDAAGELRVLEDNCRTPSGLAYALAARDAIEVCLPHRESVRNVRSELIGLLSGALAAARPDEEGIVALLSDGAANTAWFEHRTLAGMIGVRLLTPDDLRADGDRLVLRASGRPVDALYRRTDVDRLRDERGELTDLGELLLPALRAGTLGLVNAFGTGVADDKAVYPYVDDLVRFFCEEEPLVPSVPTYDLADPDARAEALGRPHELVLKPRDGHGGHGVVIGPRASRDELREAVDGVRADPEGWIAQEPVLLSTHPTVVDGRLVPRHVDLRPFCVAGRDGWRVVPGGLTRVALEEGQLVVNSSRGGGGKDTWVLP